MTKFEVVIIGGSYAGLAAAMGLGRALRNVLVVDSGMPANRFDPQSHNLLTHDGRAPAEIISIAKLQVDKYETVHRIDGRVVNAERLDDNFRITLADGTHIGASKLVFATGIIDIIPVITGFTQCWGKSILHCPYCHGFEVRNERTGIFGNGNYAFEFGALIHNWTSKLSIYTNGSSTLTPEQSTKLQSNNINIIEDEIEQIRHTDGYVEAIVFRNGRTTPIKAMYTRPGFKQHSEIPKSLGCELTDEGYINIDLGFRTSIPGVYACGDNVTRLRTVANAIAMGTTTAITLNKDMILESFRI
jgi:thioredoxin reductase